MINRNTEGPSSKNDHSIFEKPNPDNFDRIMKDIQRQNSKVADKKKKKSKKPKLDEVTQSKTKHEIDEDFYTKLAVIHQKDKEKYGIK